MTTRMNHFAVVYVECICPMVWGGHGEAKPDAKRRDADCHAHEETDANEASLAGWYWRALPDGDPVGPFATEAEAMTDAHAEGSV